MTILIVKDSKDVIGVVLLREGENMTDAFQRWLDAQNDEITKDFAEEGKTPDPDDFMDGENLQVDDYDVEDPEPRPRILGLPIEDRGPTIADLIGDDE